jgi:hypothetical protein
VVGEGERQDAEISDRRWGEEREFRMRGGERLKVEKGFRGWGG